MALDFASIWQRGESEERLVVDDLPLSISKQKSSSVTFRLRAFRPEVQKKRSSRCSQNLIYDHALFKEWSCIFGSGGRCYGQVGEESEAEISTYTSRATNSKPSLGLNRIFVPLVNFWGQSYTMCLFQQRQPQTQEFQSGPHHTLISSSGLLRSAPPRRRGRAS